MAEAETYKTPDELESTPQGTVRRWTTELDLAKKRDEAWLKEAKEIYDRYEAEKRQANSFNMLWSNTRIMRPAIYNSTPKPDVRRRYRDKDPLGKAAAQVLERALDYSLDAYDFDARMKDCTLDTLLPGRGVIRVYYNFESSAQEEPDTDEEGNPKVEGGKPVMRAYEVITGESATCEYVHYEDFRHGPGRRWNQVPWVAFRHKMNRQELRKYFGEVGDKVTLAEVDSECGEKDVRQLFRTAEVWEIWDKQAKKVKFICTDYKDGPLKELAAPLNLRGFFPTPRPLYAIETTRGMVPIPLYRLYEEQAKEIDMLSSRINKISSALKARGAYAAHMPELAQIFEADDNDLVPVANMSEIMASKGGLEAFIWMAPVEKLAQVLRYLYEAREQAKQVIYEIIGLSDILRGASEASETATAQRIKSQWGSLSLQDLQKEVQRYARDIIRLKAEIISEHFQMETLQAITDLKFPSAEDKRAAVMALQAGQASPDVVKTAEQPSWNEVYALLKSDEMRCYRIDIETDSTVAEQVAGDIEGLTEVITGVVNVINGFAPAVEAGAVPVQSVKDILMAVVRRARLGSVVEDAIEDMGEPKQQPQQPEGASPQSDHSLEIANLEHQVAMKDLELENGRLRLELAELQMKQRESEAEIANTQADTALKYAQVEKTQKDARTPVAVQQR